MVLTITTMNIAILKQFGLTRNQSAVYIGFLKNGELTIAELSRKIGMDKSSAYRTIDKLKAKSLIVENFKKRGTTYKAASPDILKNLQREKEFEISQQSKKLTSLINRLKKESISVKRKTYIQVEKGIDAHIKKMDESLRSSKRIIREKWNLQNPIFKNKVYSDYVFKFFKERVQRKIHLKYLASWNEPSVFDPIMKTSKKLLKEVRIIPWDIEDQNAFRIYDDIVEIISFGQKDEFLIITIRDKYVADLMKNIFDFIFNRAVIYHGKEVLPKKTINNNIAVPALGIGSWGIGGYGTRNYYNDDLNDIEQLKHSISKGQTYIDTSLTYANGHSVDIIAKAIKNFPRSELFINSKLSIDKKGSPIKSIKEIEKQCDIYLIKLNSDYIDSFMIHSPIILDISVTETVNGIERLIKKGKVKHLFVSNFSIEHLEEAKKASNCGISAHEIHYNLIIRANEENGVIDYCNDNNILLIAYQPLRRGFVYTLEGDPLISKLCLKYDKTPGQIAINWLTVKNNVMAICKSTKGSHINENVASLGWKMEKNDYRKLDEWRLPGYKTPEYDPSGKNKDMLTIDKL